MKRDTNELDTLLRSMLAVLAIVTAAAMVIR